MQLSSDRRSRGTVSLALTKQLAACGSVSVVDDRLGFVVQHDSGSLKATPKRDVFCSASVFIESPRRLPRLAVETHIPAMAVPEESIEGRWSVLMREASALGDTRRVQSG
jgi:hypothetical protein